MHDSHDEGRDQKNSNESDQAQVNVTNQPPAVAPAVQPEPSASAPVQHDVPQNPFFIEMCAGSARVTACLQQLGMPAFFGVDHVKQRNSGKVLVADLTTDNGQALFWTWLTARNCAGIFAAPPCGTRFVRPSQFALLRHLLSGSLLVHDVVVECGNSTRREIALCSFRVSVADNAAGKARGCGFPPGADLRICQVKVVQHLFWAQGLATVVWY